MVEVSYLWMANDRRQLLFTSQVFIIKSTCTVTCCSAVPLTILLMCWVIIQLSWRPAVNPHTETVTLHKLLLVWPHCKEENSHYVSLCLPFSSTTVFTKYDHSHKFTATGVTICDHKHFSCVHVAKLLVTWAKNIYLWICTKQHSKASFPGVLLSN